MKVFYDTEFLEGGKTIELISIGMVAEDGRELYLIDATAPWALIAEHDWLRGNVLPHLPGRLEPRPYVPGLYNFHLDCDDPAVRLYRSQIADEVREFIQSTPDAELWAWYGAYDHVALAQLFGRMIDLPKGVPMWTNDLKQECQRLGNPQLPKQESTEHNALADARWVRDAHAWLATALGVSPPHPVAAGSEVESLEAVEPAGGEQQ